MARLFLSHSSANNAEAIALRDWLVGHGWDDLFLDLDPERGLKAGERWQAALKQAAERCELVIFLVSPEWRASEWCVAEFLLAKNLNKRIVGVIVDPIPLEKLPTEMTAEWQLVDLTAGKRDHKVTVTPPPGNKTETVAFAEDGLERLRIGLMQAGLDARYFAWPQRMIRSVHLIAASNPFKPRMPASSLAVTAPQSLGSTCCGGSERLPHPGCCRYSSVSLGSVKIRIFRRNPVAGSSMIGSSRIDSS